MNEIRGLIRDLRAQRIAQIAYADASNRLAREAIAARSQGKIIAASKAHWAAVIAWRAGKAEQDDPEPGQ